MSPKEINEIEQACQQSTPSCLALLEVGLNDSPVHSTQWFRFKQLKLSALFNLQKLKPLQQEVNYWLSFDDTHQVKMPANFAVYIYIYNAKLTRNVDENTKSSAQIDLNLNKAINLLNEINDKVPSPLRLIEIANLQISMKDYESAKSTLISLEKKFKNRYHPIFQQELYANLGHIALQQEDHKLHTQYRKSSLRWALETPNNQQKSVAHLNLAIAYQKTNRHNDAEINYKAALAFAQLANDSKTIESIRLRLIEVAYLQGDIAQAKRLYKEIPKDFYSQSTSKHLQVLFQRLKSLLDK